MRNPAKFSIGVRIMTTFKNYHLITNRDPMVIVGIFVTL